MDRAKTYFLLSSNAVFMFSIHEGSTGPSKTIHFHSSVSEVAISRKVLPTTPSVHSWVRGSKRLRVVSCRPYLFLFIYQSKFSNHGCPFKILHCVWDPTKKGQWALHVYNIANFVVSWLKWLQMIWNDSKWVCMCQKIN